MKLFKPRPHQPQMIAHMVENEACLLFASLGSGKTGCVLKALDFLFLSGRLRRGVDRILVVAPLRVAQISWPDEARDFRWRFLTLAAAVGNEGERLAALRSDANVVTINFENVGWLLDQPEHKAFTVLVVDECSRLSGFRGMNGAAQQAKMMAKIRRRCAKRFIGLTATPGGLIKQWGMMWFCDFGRALGKNFGDFASKYFTQKQVGQSQYAVKYIPDDGADRRIFSRMKKFTLTVDAVKIFGVDEPIHLQYWIDLPPKARKAYDTMQAAAFVELEGGMQVEAASSATALFKCLQIANGAVYVTDPKTGEPSRDWAELHNAKLEALAEIVEKIDGAPLIVVYQYRHDLARILKRFKGAVEFSDKVKPKWDKGQIPMLVLHAASCGHGLSLQHGGNHLAFFGHNYNVELFEQVMGRINPMRQKQSGYDRPVYYHHIRARDTFDEAVKATLDDGLEAQAACLAYFEKKK